MNPHPHPHPSPPEVGSPWSTCSFSSLEKLTISFCSKNILGIFWCFYAHKCIPQIRRVEAGFVGN
ncbi:hypothetical protein C5167_040634 [Papaver somniferum]|uniref:Uncharacterized protein n=1 Tax=Papaver somniferum TaxID=3469 RepID=A0A4Y7IJS5_PAPSO|nr:hypothetical protein C5167_040634 [Papaver somniferum]